MPAEGAENIMQKIAIITGASRGLGKAMALHLAAAGVGIIGTYHSKKDEAEAVAAQIAASGGKAAMLQLDVSKSDTFAGFALSVKNALETIFQSQTFDFLVNNAGIAGYGAFADMTEAQFDEVMAIQLKAPFFLSQTLLPLIADGGRILNVSSGLARFSAPGFSAYAAAKAGVEVLTRYMALELGSRKIRVNAIAPGAIETDFGGGMARDNADANAYVASQIALGRVGLPDDIGGAVAAILSDGFAWANGTKIEVSGGHNL
jgi:NAD(P)-dependent dehydrogenase (short-subunit alcohol dehydrogenase family)